MSERWKEKMDEKWKNELENLLKQHSVWLDNVKCIQYGYSLEEQNTQLCIEVIKWHELAKETYALLDILYSNITSKNIDFNTEDFIKNFNSSFQNVKKNYINNIRTKEDLSRSLKNL